jgi:cyclic nucleotide gated channel
MPTKYLIAIIVIWIVIPILWNSSVDHTKNALYLMVLLQYLPILVLIFPLTSQIVRMIGLVPRLHGLELHTTYYST